MRSAELRSPAPDTSMFDTGRADPGLQSSWGRRHVDGLESTTERGPGPRKLAAGGRRSVKPMPASEFLDSLLGTDGHVEERAPQRPVRAASVRAASERAVSGLASAGTDGHVEEWAPQRPVQAASVRAVSERAVSGLASADGALPVRTPAAR